MSATDADMIGAVRAQFRADLPARIGVAVSGGGDSVALLHLLHRAFAGEPVALHVVTVDHGLRPGSAGEAEQVARMAAGLGLPHATLKWEGWDGQGNLQDQARRARYALLAGWARARAIPLIALGHTADDQAETVLMRLARAAGVDGLAAIPPRRETEGVTFLRPLLGLAREELRGFLCRHGVDWIEDPSNQDPRFERVRARQALAALAPLGITARTLCEVAAHMADARAALDWTTVKAARDGARIEAGAVFLDRALLDTLPGEILRRLFSGAISWIARAGYPPRRAALAGAISAARAGRAATLSGCALVPHRDTLCICRELQAVRDTACPPDAAWDGLWRLIGPAAPDGAEIRALGETGLAQCPDWRATGLPRALLLASPALWRGTRLLAAPLAEPGGTWRAEPLRPPESFFAAALSH